MPLMRSTFHRMLFIFSSRSDNVILVEWSEYRKSIVRIPPFFLLNATAFDFRVAHAHASFVVVIGSGADSNIIISSPHWHCGPICGHIIFFLSRQTQAGRQHIRRDERIEKPKEQWHRCDQRQHTSKSNRRFCSIWYVYNCGIHLHSRYRFWLEDKSNSRKRLPINRENLWSEWSLDRWR